MCLGGLKDQPSTEEKLQHLADVRADGREPDVDLRPSEGQRLSAREGDLVDDDTEARLELWQGAIHS